MTTTALGIAVALTRAWTRLYTWGMPPRLRDRRRAEMESDLWEFQHDAARERPLSAAAHIVARLVLGAAHDLAWRAQTAPVRPVVLFAIAGSAVAVLCIAGLWIYAAAPPGTLPTPPGMMRFVAAPPPPPTSLRP